MIYPHVMRLIGPWDFEILAGVDGGAPLSVASATAGRVKLPARWSDSVGADVFGTVRFVRPFNCPTNLESQERVWLVIEHVDGLVSIQLNGAAIGDDNVATHAAATTEFDVTARLEKHNRLAIDVLRLPPASSDDVLGSVRLEIRHAGIPAGA